MDHIGLRSKLTLYSTVRMLKLCKIHTFNKIFRNVHTCSALYGRKCFYLYEPIIYIGLPIIPHYIINILSWEPTLLPSRRNQPISVSWS